MDNHCKRLIWMWTIAKVNSRILNVKDKGKMYRLDIEVFKHPLQFSLEFETFTSFILILGYKSIADYLNLYIALEIHVFSNNKYLKSICLTIGIRS